MIVGLAHIVLGSPLGLESGLQIAILLATVSDRHRTPILTTIIFSIFVVRSRQKAHSAALCWTRWSGEAMWTVTAGSPIS